MAGVGKFVALCLLVQVHLAEVWGAGMLTPQESETRSIQELNGMWDFRADASFGRNNSMKDQWYLRKLEQSGPVRQMPVPSSYNDITTDRELQYFTGWVWYEREAYVRAAMSAERVVLRIDSAHYYTMVWINGKFAFEHDGGHLPFEGEVNSLLNFGGVNRITVAVNNTLGPHTLPPGSVTFHYDNPNYPPNYFVQNLQFDFFNYAGIHRRVRLYTTPAHDHINDIDIIPALDLHAKTATIEYRVDAAVGSGHKIRVEILDQDNKVLASNEDGKETGKMDLENVQLWWPYTESLQDYTYRYTFKVSIVSAAAAAAGTVTAAVYDVYRQKFGVRDVKVTDTQVLINGKPFYCHGAAKHEDSDLRGKGLDFAVIARDFEMMRWMGINCFRTSHYPYAEEIMEEADKRGFVVIDECPAVGIQTDENFGNETLQHHLQVMSELVRRDKNRPSAVFWSVANEPSSTKDIAGPYFKAVIEHTRSIDPQKRPVTFVSAYDYNTDKAVAYVDVICLNRYYGWYGDCGRLETIAPHMANDFDGWQRTYNKPVIMTEFGADTVVGLHTTPSFVFTEEYQVEFLHQYHTVFDVYRKSFLAGEMVWNFADFMTDETTTRVVGNRKGLLTRQRQPKMSAWLIRERYWSIINETMSKDTKHLHKATKDTSLKFTPWKL